MARLFIICGYPGSGKTTLAKELSQKLRIAVLHKDTIKEIFFKYLKVSTEEDNIKSGFYSIKVLYKLVEDNLQNGVDVIMDGLFRYEDDYILFRKWQEKYHIDIFAIVCTIEEKTRIKRTFTRPRHPGHLLRDQSFIPYDLSVYQKLPGNTLYVDTTSKTAKQITNQLIKQYFS